MSENPLLKLEALGQSIWMDFIRRGTIESGDLKRWIEEDGVSGVTSNPTIFDKAIGGSHDYDDAIHTLALQGKDVEAMYEALTVEDIRNAADLFRPVFDRTLGGDGFVSIEVSPGAAHDTQKTIAEARHLWSLVDRPNVMVKVPGTKEGLPAIRQLTGEGININITLLFGLERYREVVDAYLGGLEDLHASGKPLDHVASVASFFLSRIDVLLDPKLEELAKAGGPRSSLAHALQGQMAIASAKIAYQIYQDMFSSERFQRLARLGGRTQRVLWASTSTKNPAYSDVKYVEALIGPNTIDTLPLETLEAYRDHGRPQRTLDKDVDRAHQKMNELASLGIHMLDVTRQLEDEGVEKFIKSFDELKDTLSQRRSEILADKERGKAGSREPAETKSQSGAKTPSDRSAAGQAEKTGQKNTPGRKP